MTGYIAALPMYDLPEIAQQNRGFWQRIESGLRTRGFDGTVEYLRPSVGEGPDDLLVQPNLLMSQTCWGPISRGVTPPLSILAQPDYSGYPGGNGPRYRSAIIATGAGEHLPPPEGQDYNLPVAELAKARFAYNDETSLSGMLALAEDVANETGSNAPFYAEKIASGGHRNSLAMVARGAADMAAVDCQTWALACEHEPAAKDLHIVGWTASRMGLPYVCNPAIDARLTQDLREVLIELGCFAPEVTAA